MQNHRKVSYWWHCIACNYQCLHLENQLQFSNSKHSYFIEQRNIPFKNDISLKTIRLGVLSREKLKNRENHGRIASVNQLESRRPIADLFIMLITWQVKKLWKFVNICLKVGDSANLKCSKSTWRHLSPHGRVQNHNIKSTGHNACSALLDHGTGVINLRQLSFWYRALSCGAD